MSLTTLYAIDVVAICALVFAIYLPRHHRKDLMLAFIGVNIGVLGVTQALASAEVTAGLGLGLFGVLSIIRLRSAEMEHDEVAYFFSALALGLLGGFPLSPTWLSPLLMFSVVLAIFLADHPRLFGSRRHQIMTLDRAFVDEGEIIAHLGPRMGADIKKVIIKKVDFVHDTTVVDVRYSVGGNTAHTGVTDAYRSAEFEVRK